MKEEVDEYLTLSRVGAARNVLGPHVLLLLRKFALDTVRVMRMNDKDMSGKLSYIRVRVRLQYHPLLRLQLARRPFFVGDSDTLHRISAVE